MREDTVEPFCLSECLVSKHRALVIHINYSAYPGVKPRTRRLLLFFKSSAHRV